jgi:CRISPR/Cas system CSM-associated protein Csm4 (group 5 of RAMP superfamily)
MALIEIRLRPTGPWRAGHRTGDRERVDAVYHSDALYSAVTHAMKSLGWLEEWLDATARAAESSKDPAVRFSSLFPFVGETRLIAPPRTSWPPSGGKLYVKAAKLVPLDVARRGVVNESRWSVDGASECLLPAGMTAPFEVGMRAGAAVDRITGQTEAHRTACLEFVPSAGWWGLVDIAGEHVEAWEARVKAALRLLADSGFGGERSRGWGRAAEPEFADAAPLFGGEGHAGVWWMLSLYSPHADDAVDWSRGDYAATTRGGWTDSVAGSVKKKQVRMIEEGSVLMAPSLRGRAVDVAPDGFPHPAWRAGFALAVPVPLEVEA